MKTFTAIVLSCLLVVATAKMHAAPAPAHGSQSHDTPAPATSANQTAPAPPANATQSAPAPATGACPTPHPCPYMPVSPRIGQRSGIAAYQYEGGGPNMPANWGKLDCSKPPFDIFQGCSYCTNECGGKIQSPVDVKPAEATQLSWITGVEFNVSTNAMFKYKMASGSYKMECKEHGTCGSVMLGNEMYELLQIHTHQHSEHSLNGKLYPTEIHNVHVYNGTKLLVIGVLFEEGPANPEFGKYINHAKNLTDGGSINMAELVGPAIKPEFLTMYQGSLTTPPCSEGVRWAVSSKILTLSAEQLGELKTMAANKLDARPVQPMNDRPFLKM